MQLLLQHEKLHAAVGYVSESQWVAGLLHKASVGSS